MKKVLSVLLAAAMVMGMSVTSFAAKNDVTFGAGAAGVELDAHASDVVFTWAYHNGEWLRAADECDDLKAGDVIYFAVETEDGMIESKADEDWKIKVNKAEFVKSAEFYYDKDLKLTGASGKYLYVKVTLEKDFDHYEEDECNFYFYILDSEDKSESQYVKVTYEFADYTEIALHEEDIEDVVEVEGNAIYSLCDDDCCDLDKSATVVFEFADGVYVTARMYPGEEYLVKGKAAFAYDKALSKELDTDVETLTLNTELNVKEVLFESAKDNKQVISVVDGEVSVVEAEYVTKHELVKYFELSKGYVADAKDNGTYAIISADVELPVVEEEVVEEEVKANPETGASDFVGAAVALAVVSVAAAGALALKK